MFIGSVLHVDDVCSLSQAKDEVAYLDVLKKASGSSKDAAFFSRADLSIKEFQIEPKPFQNDVLGRLYKARPTRGDGVWYAIKRFSDDSDETKETSLARRAIEKAALRHMQLTRDVMKNNDFLIQKFAFVDDPESKSVGKAIVLELPDGRGTELVRSADKKHLSVSKARGCLCSFDYVQEEEVLLIASDLLHGIDHLHQRNFVHRDVALNNVHWVKEGDQTRYKLADFGLCCVRGASDYLPVRRLLFVVVLNFFVVASTIREHSSRSFRLYVQPELHR